MELLDEVVEKDQAIGQRIAIRLRRWLGEYSFDTRLGMDWENLLQKATTEGQLRAAIVHEINQVPGVLGIISMDIIPSGRAVSILGKVRLVGSEVAVTFDANIG